MPRPRSPERDQSYAIYEQHNGEIENRRIADMVGKDERFIAKWKHEDTWVDKLKKNKGVHHSPNEVHQNEERCTPNPATKTPTNDIPENPPGGTAAQPPLQDKPKTNNPRGGAPVGNKNAAGHGAPPGNKNAVTTGEFETIDYAGLTDEEKALVNAPIDKYDEIYDVLTLERVRRHRMMRRIHEAETAPGGMVVDSVSKTKGKTLVDGHIDSTQTNAEASINRVVNLETALSRVILGAQRGIKQLHSMELEDAKKGANSDELVDDWLAGVLDEDGQEDDISEEDS